MAAYELAQWIKCWPHKAEVPSSSPSITYARVILWLFSFSLLKKIQKILKIENMWLEKHQEDDE